MPAKHAISDKLQGSVATYLRRGGVVKLLITKLRKFIAESVTLVKKIKNGEYLAQS